MGQRWQYSILRCLGGIGVVAVVTGACHWPWRVNGTTAALAYLLAILLIATIWELAVAVTMSVASMLAFNYYFLPPIGTLTIADPQNWIALFAFLVTSVIAGHLSSRARLQAEVAHHRRREIEKLYQFTQQLLGEGNIIELLNAIPGHVVESFEAGAAALFLAEKEKIYRSGQELPQLDVNQLKTILAREEPVIDAGRNLCFAPVRQGVRAVGSLGISGPLLSRQTLDALGSLIGIAMERARAIEQLGKTEANREGDRLKTALLESITHDFRTPLTSIKASVTSLLTSEALGPAGRKELLTVIDEESNRLNRLVGEAAEMALLDAGEFELRIAPHPIQEVLSAAVEQCKSTLGKRIVQLRIPDNLPAVMVDLDRMKQALVQLLENAHRYSPEGEPITVSAELNGNFVVASVADRGSGIEELEQGLIFDKFYRGRDQRYRVQGTGMGLPIAKAIVEAHGGTLGVVSQLGKGSVFSCSLPIDRGPRERR
jgi:two-component system, OmpR family, sensor histidine kinase KdpD